MKTLHVGNSIVIDPESSPSPAVVVYGGLYGWEGKWLVHEIPASLRGSVIFVLPTHFTHDCNACLKELHTKISPANISSYSLCGYSRGGVEVYRYRNLAQWKILGLIDPSAPTMGGFPETVLDSFSSKIRCVCVLGAELGERRIRWQDSQFRQTLAGSESKDRRAGDSTPAHALVVL